MDSLLRLRQSVIGVIILVLLGGLAMLGGCARQPTPMVTITPAGPTLAFESIVRMGPDLHRTYLYSLRQASTGNIRVPGLVIFTTPESFVWFEAQLEYPSSFDQAVLDALHETDFSQYFCLLILFEEPAGNPDEQVTTQHVELLNDETIQIVSGLTYTSEWATIYAHLTNLPGTLIAIHVDLGAELRYELIRVQRPDILTEQVVFELVEIQPEVINGVIRNKVTVLDQQRVDWIP